MKFLAVLLASAVAGVMAHDTLFTTSEGLEVYQIDNNTVIGAPNTKIAARGTECNSYGYAFGRGCTPGVCDCGGNNGCWWWSNQPGPMCQCGPSANRGEGANCW